MAFEAIGIVMIAPLYSYFFDAGAAESLTLLVALSVLLTIWTGIHNTVFDQVQWHMDKRVASDRSTCIRVIHATSLEVSSALVSIPLILAMTELSLWEAILVDLVLTFLYVIYGFFFHLVFDYIRPVKTGEVNG